MGAQAGTCKPMIQHGLGLRFRELVEPYNAPMRRALFDQSGFMEVFGAFLRLGLTAFGGPVAHLGYFRDEFVVRRQWLDEQAYADLLALCQFLPGPASSQVGMALGLMRAGHLGALAAWLGFTLPSAVVMTLLALGVGYLEPDSLVGVTHGLKLAAVAVVAQAVWGMAHSLCPDWRRRILMLAAALLVGVLPLPWGTWLVIMLGGGIGLLSLRLPASGVTTRLTMAVSRRVGGICLLLFFVLLAGLPLLTMQWPNTALSIFVVFYRVGALVFGGGHVVLPLLQAELVGAGKVAEDVFLAGYGAAQAVPGPLFTFAAFLGAALTSAPNGVLGAVLALLAIFLPSFLLVVGALPFWAGLRQNRHARAALAGINAAVVGILLAALYQPVGRAAIHDGGDVLLAVLGFWALQRWACPAWLLVGVYAVLGWMLAG